MYQLFDSIYAPSDGDSLAAPTKGGAGFESAIWGWLVSPAGRPLNFLILCTNFG
jgi:hypothetical protein